jgi:hypothetical protein
MKSVVGEWVVETANGKANFKVHYANTFDEPVGGLMNVLLTEDDQHYQYPQIGNGRSLVIDIGGFTTDFLAVNQGGEVDYALARSVLLGIQAVIRDFEESFRANNLEIVKDTQVLPPDRVRKAISTGVFVGGGQKYSCDQDVDEATSLFLNRFADTYQRLAGGALSWVIANLPAQETIIFLKIDCFRFQTRYFGLPGMNPISHGLIIPNLLGCQ